MDSVLSNKQYRKYTGISRYSYFPIYYHNIDEKWVGGTTKYLRDDTPYNYYITQDGDTFDNIALYFYNNPTLYWVICSFNNIQNPFLNLEAGTTLKIPVLSTISYGD